MFKTHYPAMVLFLHISSVIFSRFLSEFVFSLLHYSSDDDHDIHLRQVCLVYLYTIELMKVLFCAVVIGAHITAGSQKINILHW
jgi:hypothetical protein